jgi:hypothetical protein
MDTRPWYTYSKLPKSISRPFRVLTILPGSKTSPLECSIDVADLDNPPQYEALSYCWGKSAPTASILCNKARLMIRDNLWDALYRMRHPNQSRCLWVDAICINQDNVRERNHQVSLMGFIYRRATKVLAWVGNEHSHFAIPLLAFAHQKRSWDNFFERKNRGSLDFTPIDLNEALFEGDLSKQGEEDRSSSWGIDLSKNGLLFENPWFERMWVIQEVMLASEVEVLWGDFIIGWWTIRQTVTRYGGYPSAMDSLRLVTDNARDHPIMGQPLSFLLLMERTRRFGTSDPRDHVFALLGVPTTDAKPEEGHLLLQPDYELSLNMLDLKLARALLKTPSGLYMLAHVHHGAQLQLDYPSWVPRWQKASTEALNRDYGRFAYSVTGYPGFTIENDVLHVDGACYSRVARIGPLMLRRSPGYGVSMTTSSTKDWSQNDWHAMEQILEGFDMTYLLSLMWSVFEVPDKSQRIVDWIKHRWINQHNAVMSEVERGLCSEFSYLSDGRRLFIMTSGKLGIGPEALNPGDVLIFCRGTEFPFAVRRHDDHYLFVGECSVPSSDRHMLFSKDTRRVAEDEVQSFEIH